MRLLGSTTRGIWTRAQALELLTPDQVRRLVGSGIWQRPWPGVYADGGTELDAVQRAYAAVLASGGAGQPSGDPPRLHAVAAGRTAARVHGFVLVDDEDPATGARDHLLDDVTTWRDARALHRPVVETTLDRRGVERRHEVQRVLHRRVLRLADGDLARTEDGLWLTSRARTVADCARLLSYEAVVALIDDALHRKLLTVAQLQAAVARRAWHPGAVTLRRALGDADGRAESPTETLGRFLLRPLLPRLRPQVELHDRFGGLVARFDLGDEVLMLGVELDGKRGHAGEVMRAKDRRRDRRTESYAWATERGTWWDVRRGQAAFVAQVMAAARQRPGWC